MLYLSNVENKIAGLQNLFIKINFNTFFLAFAAISTQMDYGNEGILMFGLLEATPKKIEPSNLEGSIFYSTCSVS
jgi:hypothetical protein